jgi:hypothetical protein
MTLFDWIWRQFHGIDKEEEHGIAQKGRTYHFELPYKIDTIYLHYGLQMLRKEGVFQKLPKDLQEKWIKAKDAWHPLKVTKADLDRIDNNTWARIANKLKLKWE